MGHLIGEDAPMGFASAPFDLDQRRREISATLDPRRRSALGQFLTPTSTAGFMASLLEFHLNKPAHLLDPGAGIGALSAAAAECWRSAKRRRGSLELTCYELEPGFWDPLEATLGTVPGVQYEIRKTDFIAAAVKAASRGEHPYTHAILNPPYKKVQTASRHRTLVRKLGLETSNLYACFVACAVAASQAGAQVVAIIPRSWMNGLYFKPFRYWLFGRAALSHIHIFRAAGQRLRGRWRAAGKRDHQAGGRRIARRSRGVGFCR
jgi:adenine-specific DNA-methyltransferase